MARELLDDSSSEGASSSEADSIELKVNQDFAQRFEHNKKREELQRLEEKHGKLTQKRKRDDDYGPASESDNSSSESEDEDDLGELATTTLDSEITATLNAIKSRDPRVYDGKTSFYTASEDKVVGTEEKSSKPMYLRDYHRETLLGGMLTEEEDEPMTYDQEQEQLKQSIIKEMHAVPEDSDEGGEDLLVAKKREKATGPVIALDVENADRDPETFLSNFMAARAWVPTEKSTWKPLESDDEEEEARAEAYEQAYNMRFEDPNKSNETLRTHARDLAAKYSVRRDDQNSRKRKRDTEKEQKELEKQERREEKARLRKLRTEAAEEKVQKIKKAAGLKTSDIKSEDWARFVDDEWDDAKWEQEMQGRFGEDYYAMDDLPSDEDGQKPDKKRKPKKPKFEDDIDINDIVSDFQEDKGEFSLTEDEIPAKEKKDYKRLKEEKKRDSKKERRIIEQLVDDQLQLELDSALLGKAKGFRYRETSPQSFGLTSRDILMADDSQLNEFAGLKKLATFRDAERKRKDRKHLGKKARLRQWRKDTFGNEDGLQESELLPAQVQSYAGEDTIDGETNIRITGKKRRRSKKQKAVIE